MTNSSSSARFVATLVAMCLLTAVNPLTAQPLPSRQPQTQTQRAADWPAPATRQDFVEGVALGLYFRETGRSYESYLWEIASTGASAVSLVWPRTMRSVHASQIESRPTVTPAEADIRAAIRAAHALGLEVMLFPILQIEERAPGEWRGRLAPEDRDAWWGAYRAWLHAVATLAQQESVAWLSVGSELGTMERDEAAWRALIANVRDVFGGQLLYSANWDHYARTPFWDAVDAIGLTGYFELTPTPETPLDNEALAASWEHHIAPIREVSSREQRPVILTEVGYPSQPGAAWHPWDYTRSQGPDLETQRRLYVALFRAWNDEPMLHGLFFWNWFGEGGPTDNGYTPRHKPAEAVIRHWFGASPPP